MINTPELPVHFFTIVLNGEPFIRYHINVLNRLPFRWHWHVVEGVAELRHDTAWALAYGGAVPEAYHENGLSNDGTTNYLDRLAALFPDNVSVYRLEQGKMWDGKCTMINAPLNYIREECLLWQIDVDEFWTEDQLCRGRELFLRNREKTAAWYDCHFFVGPNLLISDTEAEGHRLSTNWLRTWRYTPGCRWASHEPPVLVRPGAKRAHLDIGRENPFLPDDTRHEGLVFQHKAYILKKQLRFKEAYYGYHGATMNWLLLQKQHDFPLQLKEFFPWPFVANGTLVIRDIQAGVKSIPLPEESEYVVLDTPQDLNKLSRFIKRMAQDIYPETPSLLHSEITSKALVKLEELFPLQPGMHVLDVGCGQGPALEYFSSRKLEYLGITLSEEDIAECRAKGYRVEKMDQSFLTFSNGSKDLVWARHVIEHSIFPLFTLEGFWKVLKPGGMLYLEAPAPETSCHHERNPNHYSVLPKGCWRALLERCGFKILGDVDYSFEVPAGPDVYWGFYCQKLDTEIGVHNRYYGLDRLDNKLLAYIGDISKGFFVEAGAHDGVSQSNTKLLEEMGWSGLLVEPSPTAFAQCQKNRCNPVENCALVSGTYRESSICGSFDGSLLSGVLGSSMRSSSGIVIPARTVASLFRQYKISHVDFFSLDVEGYELEVLHGIDWDEVTIDWFLIEVNSTAYDISSFFNYMNSVGYDCIAKLSDHESNPYWDGTHQDYLFKRKGKRGSR